MQYVVMCSLGPRDSDLQFSHFGLDYEDFMVAWVMSNQARRDEEP